MKSSRPPDDGRELLASIRQCSVCADLPLGPRPILQWHPSARILIAGQAPGRITHQRGIPFDDPSGERLRNWLGVDASSFYDPRLFAILPMGFCYPGTGQSGDLPPRPECAEKWRNRLLGQLGQLELSIIIGKFAVDWHLGRQAGSLTEKVANWRTTLPNMLVLPHPSPRNRGWLKRNAWFEADLLPQLRDRVRHITSSATAAEQGGTKR